MLKKILTYSIIGALSGFVLAWILFTPRVETSDLYKTYESREDLDVAFVKDYSIDDSTFVDVVTITAHDSLAWKSLQTDFAVTVWPEEFLQMYIDNNTVDIWLASKDDLSIHPYMEYGKNILVSMSESLKTFCIFYIENKEQMKSITSYKTNELTTKK